MLGQSEAVLLVTALVFAAGVLAVTALARGLGERDRVRRRYAALAVGSEAGVAGFDPGPARSALDPGRLGLDADAQRRLRTDLIRAGFFDARAVGLYAAARLALLAGLPVLGALVAFPLIAGATERVAVVAVLGLVAYLAPRSYLSARQRGLEGQYRLVFPDFLDMLVVCINAGLGLEAALDRAGRELGDEDAAFRTNLDLMAAEIRAGKSTPDALRALADRLSLREARAFAGLLQQTIELGTDVAGALTVFADEMRDKRMSNAEERAAALPPKLTLPLGLFIFPVVLIVVLAPAVVRIMNAIGN